MLFFRMEPGKFIIGFSMSRKTISCYNLVDLEFSGTYQKIKWRFKPVTLLQNDVLNTFIQLMGRKFNELQFILDETPSSSTLLSAVNDPGEKNGENDQSFEGISHESDNSSNSL